MTHSRSKFRSLDSPEPRLPGDDIILVTRTILILQLSWVTNLLAVLHRHADTLGEQKVAEIEWAYLPALGWGRLNLPGFHAGCLV